jgi:hypothetical protein
LRNSIAVEIESFETLEILGTRVFAVCGSERFPDRLPDAVFELGVRSGRDGRAGCVCHGDLRDRVAPRAVIGVAKSRVVGVELHEGVAILDRGVAVCGDHAHVDMVE